MKRVLRVHCIVLKRKNTSHQDSILLFELIFISDGK